MSWKSVGSRHPSTSSSPSLLLQKWRRRGNYFLDRLPRTANAPCVLVRGYCRSPLRGFGLALARRFFESPERCGFNSYRVDDIFLGGFPGQRGNAELRMKNAESGGDG